MIDTSLGELVKLGLRLLGMQKTELARNADVYTGVVPTTYRPRNFA